MEEFHALGEQGNTMDVAAIFQRNAQRSGRPGGKPFVPRRQPFVPRSAQRERPPGGARDAPRDKADQKCANCLKTGHAAVDCRQPKVDKRTCFLCLGEGHQARNCPNKEKSVPAHARLLEKTSTVEVFSSKRRAWASTLLSLLGQLRAWCPPPKQRDHFRLSTLGCL